MSGTTELLTLLTSVLNVEAVPEDVERKLQDEALDTRSIQLLNEDDLKELGFKMGHRKLILQWIETQRNFCLGSPASSTVSGHSISSALELESTPTSSSQQTLQSFKDFPIEALVLKHKDGQDVVSRVKSGQYSRKDLCFIVRIAAKYLMNKCSVKDKPSKQEKVTMSQSIIDCFPALRDPETGGFQLIYDPRSHTGHLESYIRCRRSRDPTIATLWTHNTARQLCLPSPNNACSDERFLRERRPNIGNRTELLELMERTRDERRQWINSAKPSITEILQRYPRFQDVNDSIKEEFYAISGTDVTLTARWLEIKEAVLTVAGKDPACCSLVAESIDDHDEGSDMA